MNIIQAKERLNKLERDIEGMVRDFETDCGIIIKYINVRRIDVSTMDQERSLLNKITITAEL
jgi:hypothetical protein